MGHHVLTRAPLSFFWSCPKHEGTFLHILWDPGGAPGGKSHNMVVDWVSGVNNSPSVHDEPLAICQLQVPVLVPQVNNLCSISELWLPVFTCLSFLGAMFALCPSLPCGSTDAMKYIFNRGRGSWRQKCSGFMKAIVLSTTNLLLSVYCLTFHLIQSSFYSERIYFHRF